MSRIKKIIAKIFKPWIYYHYVEIESIAELENRYIKYKAIPNKTDLIIMVHLVKYMNRIKVNGKTEKIKQKILNEWDIHFEGEK